MSRRRDALRAALAAQTSADGPAALPTSPAVLAELAQRAFSRNLTGADLDALGALAGAAAVHGYPAPALQRLGQQVAAVPSARTSDPSTSKRARGPVVPKVSNHVGLLLIAYREREHVAPADDRAMTSEESARVAGLDPRSEYAKRASELLALGYLRVALDDDGHERTRKGAAGLQRLVLELTDDGRAFADALLAELR